jgi:hypothetical protein
MHSVLAQPSGVARSCATVSVAALFVPHGSLSLVRRQHENDKPAVF